MFDTLYILTMRLLDLSHTIDLLAKKICELQTRHNSISCELASRIDTQKLEIADKSWQSVILDMQLNIDTCLSYLKTAYASTLDICNNFWIALWYLENKMYKLNNTLVYFDSDLYSYPWFTNSQKEPQKNFACFRQFYKPDKIKQIENATQKKMERFEKMLAAQATIETLLFEILSTELKLVETYIQDENDKTLHKSFVAQFEELLAEMLEIQAKRLAIFDCASMRPEYARFEHLKNQVKAMRKIVAYVNIDCSRIA